MRISSSKDKEALHRPTLLRHQIKMKDVSRSFLLSKRVRGVKASRLSLRVSPRDSQRVSHRALVWILSMVVPLLFASYLFVSHEDIHLRNAKASLSPQKEEKRYNPLAKKKTTTSTTTATTVQIWSREEIKRKTMIHHLGDGVDRMKAELLIGNSPLFDNLEITEVCLKALEAIHPGFDTHMDGLIQLVTKGSIAFHSISNTTLLLSKKHKLGPTPEVIHLSPGGIVFTDSYALHNVGGPEGGCYVNFQFTVRGNHGDNTRLKTDSLVALFQSPPLSATAVNGEAFFDRDNVMQLGSVVALKKRCAHSGHPDTDHEVLFTVEHIPEDVTLYFLPDEKILHEGDILFYPLHGLHGIEARYTGNGTVVPYRKQTNFPDTPRCLVIELWEN